MSEVTERITTEDDGPGTVNERLSMGGPGPEGQPDTVTERLSGSSPAEPDDDGPPSPSALKGEWVDHAVEHGMDRSDAEDATKVELVERFSDE